MRLSFRQTLSAALAFGALIASGAATAGDDLEACRSKGQIKVTGRWTRISAPPMDANEGARTITAFTSTPPVDPENPDRLFVTNGTVIKRSDDGGCTWTLLQRSSTIGEVPNGQYQADTFNHLVAPNVSQLWATSYDEANGVTRPHVHIFQGLEKAGPAQHNMVENGLPPVGMPLALLAAPGASGALYVLIEEPPDPATGSLDPVRRVYTTVVPNNPPQLAAVGTIWQRVKAPSGFGLIEGISLAGPSRSLWIRGKDKVALTPDASVEEPVWTEVPVSEGRVAGVDTDALGKTLVAVETSQRTPGGLFLDSKAKRVGPAAVPAIPVSMAHGTRPETRALSGTAGTYGYDGYREKWFNITPKGVGAPLQGLQFASGKATRILLGHAKGYLHRFDMYEGESFAPGAPPLLGDGYGKLPHSRISRPTITPERAVVEVQPGEVKDAPVTFGMPAQVNPLDVYFLVDTTSSMQAAINSLRADIKTIAQGIREALGRDACFGVGDFKDFDENTAALDSDKVYRTHQKIVCEKPDMPLMTAALDRLQQGGGGDDPEAQTLALTQALSGEGSIRPPVAPGQDAGFRPGSYKIIVMISDVWFKQEAGYPTIKEAARSLKVNEVKVVNVLVQNNDEDWLNRARKDMDELAEATESVAPRGGVDCDGNGKFDKYDVEPGRPLTCVANGSQPNVGPVIVSLLLGVEDPGTIAVDVTDPHHVIRGQVRGSTRRIVNLKREAALGFTLPVGCTKAQDGQDLPIGLEPSVRAVPLPLRGEIVVRCRSIVPPVVPPPPPRVAEPPPPPVQPEPIIPIPPRLPVGIAVPPPLNPPAQPVSNMNLNAGMSQQEEQQFQIATVTQGAEEGEAQEEIELAMMGLEQDTSATPVAAFLTGAMVISAAAGFAYRRRLQRTTQTAYARVG